jgi:E3 ubiquitin-protein ligase synoviolin
MRPWDSTDTAQVERSRAKKLPCGHILHFGCLKSWLERQQVCPTCRRPVARDGQPPAGNGPAVVLRLGLGFPAGENRQPQPPANGQAAPGGQPAQGGAADNQGNNQNRNVRMFNLGPLRLGFAQGGVDEIREMAQRLRAPLDVGNQPAPPTPTVAAPQEDNNDANPGLEQLRGQLMTLGQQVRQEMINVHNAAHEVQVLSLLMNELTRLRQVQQQPQGHHQGPQPVATGAAHGVQAHLAHQQQGLMHPFMHAPMPGQHPTASPHMLGARPPPAVTRHVGAGPGAAIPAGSPDLPEGVVIPPGWSLLPLQRMDGEAPPPEPTHNAQGPAPDTLRSVFANHPRSRGTSPAPGTGLAAQLGRFAAPTASHAAESFRRPGSQGGTSTDAAVQRPPPVTAPTPRTPNWGPPAQLFGGDRITGPVFGYQVEAPQAPQSEAGESSRNTAAGTGAEVNGFASGERSSGQQAEAEADTVEVNGSASDRGPRAVTVEEAEDGEGAS